MPLRALCVRLITQISCIIKCNFTKKRHDGVCPVEASSNNKWVDHAHNSEVEKRNTNNKGISNMASLADPAECVVTVCGNHAFGVMSLDGENGQKKKKKFERKKR